MEVRETGDEGSEGNWRWEGGEEIGDWRRGEVRGTGDEGSDGDWRLSHGRLCPTFNLFSISPIFLSNVPIFLIKVFMTVQLQNHSTVTRQIAVNSPPRKIPADKVYSENTLSAAASRLVSTSASAIFVT